MYCTNCGSKISSDMRFCPQCGQRIRKDAEAQIAANNDVLATLSPNQRDELIHGVAEHLVEVGFAALQELAEHFTYIAKYGPVEDDDMKEAITQYNEWRDSPSAERNPLVLAVLPWVFVNEIARALHQRWLNNANPQQMQEIVMQDWSFLASSSDIDFWEHIGGGRDDFGRNFDELLRDYKGLRIWLKRKILYQLLIAKKLWKMNVPRDMDLIDARFFNEINRKQIQTLIREVTRL